MESIMSDQQKRPGLDNPIRSLRRVAMRSVLVCFAMVNPVYAYNPPERLTVDRPTFAENTARPLRYRPENGDFVIINGGEFYNRPLYGGNTAFRADAGDMPEVSLYMPGQGGNLRFGVRSANGDFWLHQAQHIVARYRPGAMIYQITDSRLGDAVLQLSMVGLYEEDGLIVCLEQRGLSCPLTVLVAFGGAGGKRGSRSGDIGCESEPISQFFQLRPDNCRGNEFTLNENTFILNSRVATLAGTLPVSSRLAIADATGWYDPDALMKTIGQPTDCPVLAACMSLAAGQPAYLAIKRIGQSEAPFAADALPEMFAACQEHRKAIAERVVVQTPDPYINAAVGALCVAADALWDQQQGSVMHGAVAWRSAYPGWRGPYANDALGWHDRSRSHLTVWARRQNTNPVPDKVLGPDPAANYARSHPSKQTNGDICGKHYDMNLIYMDTLLRHLFWTGDLELAERLWPVIERHIAWEQRLFRRPFGPDKLPLYEAYAAIWASDDMQFNGGGVAYTSAYNAYHFRWFAELAERLGKNPEPFRHEAELINKAMQRYLWLADLGWYAEYKDLLGLQQAHPAAGLWSFYHTIDSEMADSFQAWQMTRCIDTQIAHIPIHGEDIPKGRFFTLPTSNWMPYTYSTNNVVMAEVAHTALAYWQAGRVEKAFSLFKGAVLDGMYMGLCPGNAGMTTYFDAARGEAQRDFGDAVGALSRAVIEGLFGIRPDLLNGQLTVEPGFPPWESARIVHPNIEFAYFQKAHVSTYTVKPNFSRSVALRLIVPARTVEIERLTVNGKIAEWNPVGRAVGGPRIEVRCEPADVYEVEIVWAGEQQAHISGPQVVAAGGRLRAAGKAELAGVKDPQNALKDIRLLKDVRLLPCVVEATAAGAMGHRTAFLQVRQGQMTWWAPLEFEIRPPYEIIAAAAQTANSITFYVRNNTADALQGQAVIASAGNSITQPLTIAAFGDSEPITLSAEEFALLPGTNRVAVVLDEERDIEGDVINWHIRPDRDSLTWETVNLKPLFNDKISRIFKNEYLSPRSPYCSLAIPKQGIGSWCNFTKTFDVDDSGLRRLAAENDGRVMLPQSIFFKMPAEPDANNIIFTSQWDNFPEKCDIPLSGKARHLYLLMAGSTNSMQSRFDNGVVVVTYTDGQTEQLPLHNPTTWWPIEQDYFIDDFAFRRPEPIPPRIDLKTGHIRITKWADFKGKGGTVAGGAATVVDMPLRADKELSSLTVRTLANEVVIGLISATLVR